MIENGSLHILVVDDNRSAADALARVLGKGGDRVTPLYDGRSAIAYIQATPPDVVLTDLKMEPVDGMEVLHAARAMRPPVECIVFTAYGAVDVAVEAMRIGARDFLTKPVTVEQVKARLQPLRNSAQEEEDSTPPEFIARSTSTQNLLASLKLAASVQSRVLIEGEIGSGRVYAAKVLHHYGDADGPFTVMDLGREQPWPTSGTVVLPNIDDLPKDLQGRLYRKLQYVPKNLRIIATAQPDGRRLIAEDKLRAELYYNLAVVVVPVPAIRQRVEDIQPLFRQALRTFANRYRQPVPVLPERMYNDLKRHTWPGNVRELLNMAERMVAMGADHSPVQVLQTNGSDLPILKPGFNLAAHLEDVERRILMHALRSTNGDRNEAGKLLSVERNTLRYKLKKYGLLD
ncbi:MAG: response regulator [Rhodobacterales bacterium]|nr:response regulator [Rhodobacterales bacterium]